MAKDPAHTPREGMDLHRGNIGEVDGRNWERKKKITKRYTSR